MRLHPWHATRYLLYLTWHLVAGALAVVRAAWSRDPSISPAIVEFPLHCTTDFEVTTLASSITITPGTLVLGAAPAEGQVPVTLFVHSMFGGDRDSMLAGLRDMEGRLLQATRRGQGRP